METQVRDKHIKKIAIHISLVDVCLVSSMKFQNYFVQLTQQGRIILTKVDKIINIFKYDGKVEFILYCCVLVLKNTFLLRIFQISTLKRVLPISLTKLHRQNMYMKIVGVC